jgi:hypothetical protein
VAVPAVSASVKCATTASVIACPSVAAGCVTLVIVKAASVTVAVLIVLEVVAVPRSLTRTVKAVAVLISSA